MSNILVWAHEFLCAVLLWGCFVRAVRADTRVILSVRVAFNLLALAACWGMVAPLLGHVPDAWSVFALGAIAYTQWITTAHWYTGPPERFIDPKYRPTRRRLTDFMDSHHA